MADFKKQRRQVHTAEPFAFAVYVACGSVPACNLSVNNGSSLHTGGLTAELVGFV